MQTAIALSLSLLLLPTLPAKAQSGGFIGPDNLRTVAAAEVASLAEDENIRLIGYIVESVGSDEYTFSDATGRIVVEVDSDEWNGLAVTPETRVEIAGEVDRERDRVEVEVDSIRLAP